MTFMIERLAPVYSPKDGDQVVWRKIRNMKGDKPMEWGTQREAQAFAEMFVGAGLNEGVRVVEVFDA